MWLLEGDGQVLQGKKLWLRPGKKYLFGRTVAEPGQTAISDKTISRKHLTITVDPVVDGDGPQPATRSTLTIEDLKTKIGTVVNSTQIRGEKYVVTEDENEIKMGHCSKLFRIKWFPVVFTFSFAVKDLRADPMSKLRVDLEHLDVKFLTEYNIRHTTHTIAKKRNTSKGLQALINGKYIVTESFVKAVMAAAAPAQDGGPSLLEQDFEAYWPDALAYLPPPGEEPVERPPLMLAPDLARANIFEGYTFIFFNQKQFDALLAAITNGKGKALVHPVTPKESQIDDFIRYVKSVAGEKGLGEFEDGSEGKGVVVVRYIPKQGSDIDWYQEFTANVALRLDHRPIDQRDFLDAIIMKDASVLRRPLEAESTPTSSLRTVPSWGRGARSQTTGVIDVGEPPAELEAAPQAEPAAQPTPALRRGRVRRVGASRFKGFDDDDDEMVVTETLPASVPESQGLFVSQNPDPEPEPEPIPAARTRRSQRKRQASSSPPPQTQESHTQEELMDAIAPTAAAVKRRRIERGETPIPKDPVPVTEPKPAEKAKEVRVKKELNILDVARQNLEQAEAVTEKERQELAQAFKGVDLAEIRHLAIVEEMPVREPSRRHADGEEEEEEADGRWDPRWNGRRNFKAFRKQGAENARRPRPRTIVAVEEVRAKVFGIGNEYFLEDEPLPTPLALSSNGTKANEPIISQGRNGSKSQAKTQVQVRGQRGKRAISVDPDDSMLEDSLGEEQEEEPLHRTRVAKKAQKLQSQRAEASQRSQSTSQRTQHSWARAAASGIGMNTRASGRKRPAGPDPQPSAAKKQRAEANSDDEDESADELGFKFRRRAAF